MLIQGTGDSADVKSEVNLFDHGDILYGKLRPYFRKSSIVRFRGGCSTEILVLRPNKGFSRGFAFALISSSYFSELATSISTGTGLPRTQWNSMKSLKFDIPSHDVCEILGEIADDINSLRHLQSITNSLILEIISSLFRSWFIDFDPVKANAEGKLSYGMDEETAIDWFHYNIEPLGNYYNISFDYNIEGHCSLSHEDKNSINLTAQCSRQKEEK